MLKRYTQSPSGTLILQATIYTKEEHGIQRSHIDSDALAVINRLRKSGFESYIVGGAVRDIILGRSPKDFDLATNASPSAIRKIFRNSRIIGRRFRLVHIFFRNGKIIELSTFRSGNNNNYGSLEEDVQRRDFSINALYYDPSREQLIDFLGGFEHLKKHKLRSPIPLAKIFIEDPVRIIRGIKYWVLSGAEPDSDLINRMKSDAHLLKGVSQSRMTEELYKIFTSGFSSDIMYTLERVGIVQHILPNFGLLSGTRRGIARPFKWVSKRRGIYVHLQKLDAQEHITRAESIRSLIWDFVVELKMQGLNYSGICEAVKRTLEPMCPSNKDIEDAVSLVD